MREVKYHTGDALKTAAKNYVKPPASPSYFEKAMTNKILPIVKKAGTFGKKAAALGTKGAVSTGLLGFMSKIAGKAAIPIEILRSEKVGQGSEEFVTQVAFDDQRKREQEAKNMVKWLKEDPVEKIRQAMKDLKK